LATYAAGEVVFLESLSPKEQWEARNALLRLAPHVLDSRQPNGVGL